MSALHRIKILDSHTGGEPTRLVLEGGPDLGAGPLADRVKVFKEKHDQFRSAIVGEPRGSEVVVGALLCEPQDKSCQFGVIFFNNVGYLGMCGHGTIGLVVSLAHLGKIKPGSVKLDTPAGPIEAMLHANGEVSFTNVPSYRKEQGIEVYLPGVGDVSCDIAWGGNWFCLIENHDQTLEVSNAAQLTEYCSRIRQAVSDSGFPDVDHVELFGPPTKAGANSKNFVLCPGKAYDRSPCGTGTSAKLACLAADGKLAPGDEWVQESIVGSVFRGKYRKQGDKIIPTITGTAHVTGEATLLIDPADPFAWGIR
ncbi:MAG: 4-hydroxyproline epimerase [Lacunisphaera sp.]|nr:4-hydroxyproline epimerase [Lacunisphaera sp.]MDB6166419.1 4-hydroxyproline epimerase [Lacunisphaera sp.]